MILRTERDRCAHLLRRFGLGASEAEIAYYMADGTLNGAIERLLNFDAVPDSNTISLSDLVVQAKERKAIPFPAVSAYWVLRILQTQRPLQEKMTVFWHNHFATSGDKVKNPMNMHQQNELLRRNAVGNFKTLLNEISKDPAMIFWLDNEYNVRGKPNENFAREVMELFTLGIGNYSEQDIQQAARAFTGWGIAAPKAAGIDDPLQRYQRFAFRDRQHDDGEKTVFGRTGPFKGEDILEMLCDNPRSAEFVAHKAWEFFAYPNPDPAVVGKVAAEFRQSGLEIKALIRAIATSPEFYSNEAHRAVYKTPVDFVIGTARQLGVGAYLEQNPVLANAPRAKLGPAIGMYNAMKNMGMALYFPPDVSGWNIGPAWITTATMVERIGWADTLFGGKGAKQGRLGFNVEPLFDQDPSAKGIATKLCSVFDVQLPPKKVATLVSAAEQATQGMLNSTNSSKTAVAVSRLIFASPEFQMM